MPETSTLSMQQDPFPASPKLRHSKQLPRRSDERRSYSSSPLSPPVAFGADSGLPPTPPTIAQDGQPALNVEPPPHADSVVNSLMSKQSSLSTPVNARSPPTPDPSPPRTNGSSSTPLERPPMFAYPSSRAESFRTAREDLSSNPDSRSVTPVGDRLSTVAEDRGLGLAFEHEEEDATPTNRTGPYFETHKGEDTIAGAEEDKESPVVEQIPDREWNTDLMRNVTIRRKRDSQPSPRKTSDPAVTIVETASPTRSTRTRRTSGLRERVEASSNSPVTPSIENFAHSIGWPAEAKDMSEHKSRDVASKRMSTSSTSSAVVEAMVIVTPPRRKQMLRHSGKNMAYRREISSPAELGATARSKHDSLRSDDVPLHRLVHKRASVAERKNRISTDSETLGYERNMSPSLSVRSTRTMDSSAHTLRHQESIRNVLQPAADILSRSSTLSRQSVSRGSFHRRMASAPESAVRTVSTPGPRNFSELSPPQSPPAAESTSARAPVSVKRPSPTLSPKPRLASPTSRKQERTRRSSPVVHHVVDTDKSLPDLPVKAEEPLIVQDVVTDVSEPVRDTTVPSQLMDRVRRLVAERDSTEESTLVPATSQDPASPENLNDYPPFLENSPPMRRGSRSARVRRWSSHSQDRASVSPEFPIRPSLDRMSTEEIVHRNHDLRRPSEEQTRVSFDLSTIRSDEHAMARHLYAQGTPFSQLSDTLEVSEATAVSIYPHNNHSLLVVQQVPRGNSSALDHYVDAPTEAHLAPEDYRDLQSTPTPPFVDAIEGERGNTEPLLQPTLNFEPSTPPMQPDLFQPSAVDSPLKNPRPPPEPPVIMFIPPTPAEELERQLVPGPPKHSDSHPQRRLTLVQRARRYSDNLITPLLSRATINRDRYTSDSHSEHHRNPQVPTVNDEDGTLHPFWRPRGFWDGFEDSDSDSDNELPSGGDTSDVEDLPPAPKRSNTLGKRLTKGIRGSGGFLIGNSLGVERHGTNKRRHHITLPPDFPRTPRTSKHTSSPKVLIQPPTMPLGSHGNTGITKRRSSNSLRSNMSYEAPRRRASWRLGRSLPGIRKYQVQYIGLSGVKDRFKERTAEKRRDKIRQSIGTRYYIDPVTPSSST